MWQKMMTWSEDMGTWHTGWWVETFLKWILLH